MATRRGRRSTSAKLARQAETHRRSVDRSLAYAAIEAERDRMHAERQDANRALRGVGIVTRGMAAPAIGSVTPAVRGQWQAMSPDAPATISEERAIEYARDRARERAATRVSNDLLARDRAAGEVQAIADAMRGN